VRTRSRPAAFRCWRVWKSSICVAALPRKNWTSSSTSMSHCSRNRRLNSAVAPDRIDAMSWLVKVSAEAYTTRPRPPRRTSRATEQARWVLPRPAPEARKSGLAPPCRPRASAKAASRARALHGPTTKVSKLRGRGGWAPLGCGSMGLRAGLGRAALGARAGTSRFRVGVLGVLESWGSRGRTASSTRIGIPASASAQCMIAAR
jgi:hypothetical protein